VSRTSPQNHARSQQGDLALLGASLAGVALVVAALLLLVAVRVGQTKAGYQVHDLRAERTRLAQERAALEVERASLLRPARLSQWARSEAGLVPVEPTRVVLVSPPSGEAQ
jgi:cell division protein FtsL